MRLHYSYIFQKLTIQANFSVSCCILVAYCLVTNKPVHFFGGKNIAIHGEPCPQDLVIDVQQATAHVD